MAKIAQTIIRAELSKRQRIDPEEKKEKLTHTLRRKDNDFPWVVGSIPVHEMTTSEFGAKN